MNNNNSNFHHLRLLQDLDLSESEAKIYELLLLSGKSKASQIAKTLGFTRPNTYNLLKSLALKELVICEGQEKKQTYSASPPEALTRLFEIKRSNVLDIEKQLNDSLSTMLAEFNLGANRPVIVNYEGKEGIIRIYTQLLRDSQNINSIQDMEKLNKFLGDYNKEFIKERVRKRMRHHLICPESSRPFADSYPAIYREMRYLPDSQFNWDIDLKITPSRVVITTFSNEAIFGTVITHPSISRSLLSMFEHLWKAAGY